MHYSSDIRFESTQICLVIRRQVILALNTLELKVDITVNCKLSSLSNQNQQLRKINAGKPPFGNK